MHSEPAVVFSNEREPCLGRILQNIRRPERRRAPCVKLQFMPRGTQ